MRQAVEFLSEIGERLNLLQSKIDSGRFKYAEKQERDRLLDEYLKLEQDLVSTLSTRASKIEAIIRQMVRHENLNKEDMPLVCEVLMRELQTVDQQLKRIGVSK